MESLSIKPKLYKGESLSIYLLRVAESNYIEFYYLIKFLKDKEYHKVGSFNYWIIDLYPKLILDFPFLLNWLKLQEDELTSSLLYSVYNKIVDEDDMANAVDFNLKIKDYYDTNHRRYCSECLIENGRYMMIWQLTDLPFCKKHNKKIHSECPSCGFNQPLLAPSLLIYECFKCNKSLLNNTCPSEDNNIGMDIIIDTWHYLLDPNQVITMKIEAYSLEVSIAIKFLYVLQQNHKQSFKQLESLYGHIMIKRLLKIAKGKNKMGRLNIPFILDIVEKTNIKLDQLNQVIVDNEFIKKHTTINNVLENTIGNCLSPWCKSFKSNISMINVKKSMYIPIRELKSAWICKDCFMKYGYKRGEKGIWVTVTDDLKDILIFIDKFDSKTSLKINQDTMNYSSTRFNYLLGYSIVHKLVNYHVRISLPPDKEILKGYKSFFGKRNLRRNICELLGISIREFYISFHKRKIQEYVHVEYFANLEKTIKKRLVFEIKQSLQLNQPVIPDELFEKLDISKIDVSRYKLRAYVNSCLKLYNH